MNSAVWSMPVGPVSSVLSIERGAREASRGSRLLELGDDVGRVAVAFLGQPGGQPRRCHPSTDREHVHVVGAARRQVGLDYPDDHLTRGVFCTEPRRVRGWLQGCTYQVHDGGLE
ncbi:hypothetical protein ADL02_03000 [Streptomyces sp. NRRL WC-3723]|nr:hypothetical protein ADL02_03000 [Streptomyces sp. NRRL WC-3723]